jgi:hypothetical protein
MTKCHYSILARVEGPRSSTNACGTVTAQLDHPEHQKTKKVSTTTRRAHLPRHFLGRSFHKKKVHFVQTVPATGRLEEHVLAPQF